jgi:integrase
MGFLFTKSVRKSHDAALKRAGVQQHFRLAISRHTYATRAAQAGVDVLTLAALLGHTRVQMTSRYVHPTDQPKREATQKLEAYKPDVVFARVPRRRSPLALDQEVHHAEEQ